MFEKEKTIHIVAAALLMIAVQIIVFAGYFGVPHRGENSLNSNPVCTQEAKQCPDGSYVSRTGPNCEFAECAKPSVQQIDTSTWQTFQSESLGFAIKHPPHWKVEDAPSSGNLRTARIVLSDNPNKSIEITFHNRLTFEAARESRAGMVEEQLEIPGSMDAYAYQDSSNGAFYSMIIHYNFTVLTVDTNYYTNPEVRKMLHTFYLPPNALNE